MEIGGRSVSYLSSSQSAQTSAMSGGSRRMVAGRVFESSTNARPISEHVWSTLGGGSSYAQPRRRWVRGTTTYAPGRAPILRCATSRHARFGVHTDAVADGRWMAYSSNESGRFEVYVVPFPTPGSRSAGLNEGRGRTALVTSRWRAVLPRSAGNSQLQSQHEP